MIDLPTAFLGGGWLVFCTEVDAKIGDSRFRPIKNSTHSNSKSIFDLSGACIIYKIIVNTTLAGGYC